MVTPTHSPYIRVSPDVKDDHVADVVSTGEGAHKDIYL
jgi:hypothetical protein